MERKSEFRLFGDHLTGVFVDDEEVDPDWGKGTRPIIYFWHYSSCFRVYAYLSSFDPLFSANKDNSSLNVLRVQKYLNNSRMKELARDNMPFMGLEIHGLAEAK